MKRKEYFVKGLFSNIFRACGETFTALPTVRLVYLSTCMEEFETKKYFMSLKITRDEWSRMPFDRLEDIDPVEQLMACDLIVKILKSYKLSPIKPHIRLVEDDFFEQDWNIESK